MSFIPCASVCVGCSAHNCECCVVLREYLRCCRFVSESLDVLKKDFDLENHFAGGL